MRLPPDLEAAILARADRIAGVTPQSPAPLVETIDEATFQRMVTDLADENGWGWFHPTISKRSKDGWPDLVLWRERILFRELKDETGQPTAAQLTVIDGLKAAGADTGIWRPSDWESIVEVLTA